MQKTTNIQYRRQDLSKGHGTPRPLRDTSKAAVDRLVNKLFEERKDILVALSKV